MKKISCLLFIVLSTATVAQTKLYTPKELKQAADYYFSTLLWEHPDPYYFCSSCKFNKLKKSIYRDLNKPLTKNEFLLTMARINSCLDTHSTVPVDIAMIEIILKALTDKIKDAAFSLLKDSIDTVSFDNFTMDSLNMFFKERNIDKDSITNSLFVLPPVETRKNGLFFLGDSINKIIEMNGISTNSMVSEAKKYINRKLNPEVNSYIINQYVNVMIAGKYNINPPFRIKFENSSRKDTVNGITLTEWKNKLSGVVIASLLRYNETPYSYEVYPANSIAVFHIQTFDIKHREDFLKQLEKFKKEVNKQAIKYIFYDLTLNGGGNHLGIEALDIVKHDTVYFRYTATKRIRSAGVQKEKINRAVLCPNGHDSNIPDNRILFVLQSALTASGADYFCRIVSENKLGILVGKPTCELTKTFSYATKDFTMPHIGVDFHVASTFVDYSDFFKSLTTSPDINWNLKNIKEFTEQELINIINYYKNKAICTN
jgi:hypothetical protein